jgi:hypothetical protein
MDAALMAEIVEDLMIKVDEEEDFHERAVWAVDRLCEMVRGLRDAYRSQQEAETEET